MSAKPFLAARIEDAIDAQVERFLRNVLRWREKVIPYTGYGSEGGARILARIVLAPRWSRTAIGKDIGRMLKRRGWRNFFTTPVSRTAVTIRLGERVVETTTARGGYVDVRVSDHGLPPGWHSALVWTAGSKRTELPVQIIGNDITVGIVSDIDDTVISTSLPRPFIAAWNSFIITEAAREAVPGMAQLYEHLQQRFPGAPVFYVSTGAWNTHPFLRRFLRRHGYPDGAMLLTDWGPTNTGWFRSGLEHKQESLDLLAAEFPQIRWILVGDDGQHDPAIYAAFAERCQCAVLAVAIRQLTPGQQFLTHGSFSSIDEGDADAAPELPMIAAPTGYGLIRGLDRYFPRPD
ncbi:App1 family protein [Propionicicella superfundia]|uniref:App1 family protein n=1 Tax=Propionicicella superfundia TaxID=348582 RepID=UPI000401B2D4|nr:phosphatase domain-containing protein [Propionicicella superfundia]